MGDTLDRDRPPRLRTSPLLLQLLESTAIVLALAVGIWAQWGLDHRPLPWWGLTLLGSATVFALLLRREGIERPRTRPRRASGRPDLVMVVLALLLAALAFPRFAGNRLRPLPTLAWLLSLVLLYAAFAAGQEPRVAQAHARPADGLRIPWHALALAGIVLAGGLLRFYQLDAIPQEMGIDMPVAYDNARDIMNGDYMIFASRAPGNEALFFYLVAAYGRLFGLSHFAIKFASALVGLGTVPALYATGRYLFNRNVGLVAAALLAVSRWHVILSRTGYRLVMVPLFVAGVIYLVARALRHGRATDFVLAGVLVGLGMYTYNAFMVVPFTLALALAIDLGLHGRDSLRRYGWGLTGLALGALVTFLPLGRYVAEDPRGYLFRVTTRVTSEEVPLPADLLGTLMGNIVRSLGMFNLRGEEGWYVNVPYLRQMGMISAALFVFGLAYALLRWRRGHNAMILVFLGGMMLPSTLSLAFPREVPSAGRGVGLLVPACLLAALPLPLAARRLAALWRARAERLQPSRASPAYLAAVVPLVAALALLGVEFHETWRAYFADYVRYQPQNNYAISLELANMLDEYAYEGPAYIKAVPEWYYTDAVRTQLHVRAEGTDWELWHLDPAQPPLSTLSGPALFILHPTDGPALELLRATFPQGMAVNHRDGAGRVAFIAFYTGALPPG